MCYVRRILCSYYAFNKVRLVRNVGWIHFIDFLCPRSPFMFEVYSYLLSVIVDLPAVSKQHKHFGVDNLRMYTVLIYKVVWYCFVLPYVICVSIFESIIRSFCFQVLLCTTFFYESWKTNAYEGAYNFITTIFTIHLLKIVLVRLTFLYYKISSLVLIKTISSS